MANQKVSRSLLDLEIKSVHLKGESAVTKVSENHNKLESCKRPHNFRDPIRGITGFPVKWTCSKCGGEVSDEARRWYVQGLNHGRQEADPTYPDLPVAADYEQLHDARVGSTLTSGSASSTPIL